MRLFFCLKVKEIVLFTKIQVCCFEHKLRQLKKIGEWGNVDDEYMPTQI